MAMPIIIVRENGLEIEVRLNENCKAPRVYSENGGLSNETWFISWDDADYEHGEFEVTEEADSKNPNKKQGKMTWKEKSPSGGGGGGGTPPGGGNPVT